MTRLVLLVVLLIPTFGRSFSPSMELCEAVADAISGKYTPEGLCEKYNGGQCEGVENLGQAVCAAMNESFCASFSEGQALCIAGHGQYCETVPHFSAGLCAVLWEPGCSQVHPDSRREWELRFLDACPF